MEKISERFLEKFTRYKESYNGKFLEEKLKNIFKEDKIKEIFVDYYNYNLKPDNILYYKKLLNSEKEQKFIKILKKTVGINHFASVLKDLNLNNDNFEEEYFFAYSCLFFVMNRFNKVTDIDLFKNIVIMWILVDNVLDDPSNSKYITLIESISLFLMEEIYKKDYSEIQNFINSRENNIVLQILKEIYNQLDETKRIPFFDSCKKLFLYSYDIRKNDNGTVKKSLEKSFLSIEIFLFCISGKTKITDEDYFTTCLFLQLIDDLLDIEKDMKENSETFVLKCSKEERNIITIILLELNNNKLSPFYKPMSYIILQILMQNKQYFDDRIHDIMGDILGLDLNIPNFKNTSQFYKAIKSILF